MYLMYFFNYIIRVSYNVTYNVIIIKSFYIWTKSRVSYSKMEKEGGFIVDFNRYYVFTV